MSDITRAITRRINDFRSDRGARLQDKRQQRILLIALIGRACDRLLVGSMRLCFKSARRQC